MSNTKVIDDYMINNELDLKRIIADYELYVKAIINKIANDKLSYEDKEEILTDVFFVLWKNNAKCTTAVNYYIAGITRNLIKEKLRKLNITYNIEDFENIIEFNNADLFYEQRKRIEHVENNYKNLNDLEIRILNLFYYSDKSIKSISKELNLSEINVKTKLYRIRKKIKKELAKGELYERYK